MKKLTILLTMLALFGMSACGYKEGVRTEASKSYLYFTGFAKEDKSVSVSIDKGTQFSVLEGKLNRYSVKPGKHLIEVYKNGELVVQREIYLGDGIAREIEVR